MIHTFLLFLFSLPLVAASYNFDVSGGAGTKLNLVATPITLTTAEDTLTITITDTAREVQLVNTGAAWAFSKSTGAVGTKFPVAQNQSMNFRVTETTVFYIMTQAGSGSLFTVLIR